MNVVSERITAHNNNQKITSSPLLSHLKLIYYQMFAKLYKIVGQYPYLVMVNGTWTDGHIKSLWSREPVIVFPPCDTECLQTVLPIDEREPLIVSVAQFRPEKNHLLQLQAFKLLRSRYAMLYRCHDRLKF